MQDDLTPAIGMVRGLLYGVAAWLFIIGMIAIISYVW